MRILDIVSDNGLEFRVVYGRREYRDGSYSKDIVVSFYDKRYPHTEHGQFIADYLPESLIDGEYGLTLYGGVPAWSVDMLTMDLVRTWLRQFVSLVPL